mgnify:CR=1 FL=1
MKSLIILIFLFSINIFAGEATVNISAKILTPIKLEVKRNVEFGNIIAGGKNIEAKTKGEVSVSGIGKVKMFWRDSESNQFQEMTKNLKMKNRLGEKFDATLFVQDKSSLKKLEFVNEEEKLIRIDGYIAELNKNLAKDDYKGAVIIRAEYINY